MTTTTQSLAPPMRAAKSRSTASRHSGTPLHPKEHGAYAIVGVPLVVALAIGGFNIVTALIVMATIAGFLANEPLMVLWGRRGRRVQLATPSAFRVLLLRLTAAFVCGALAFGLGTNSVRITLVLCFVISTVAFAMSAAGWQRTLAAQLIGIVGLTLPSVAILLAGGMDVGIALRLGVAWVVGRIATTISVRSVVAIQKESTHHHVPVINDVLLIGAAVACVSGCFSLAWECLLVTPLIIAAAALRLQPPQIRHMRRIGYSLLGANVVTSLAIIAWWIGFSLGVN